MGRPAFSEQEIEACRRRVVAAAEHLFAERGYEGVTLRALADALGQSPAAAYRYFEGKAAIFTAARLAAYGRFAEAQERASASTPDPVERLVALGDAYLRFATDDPDGYRLMFELKQPPGDPPDALREAEDRAFAPLLHAISAAVEAGRLQGDALERAHLFWAGLHGIVSLHLAGKLSHGLGLSGLQAPMKRLLFAGSQDASESPR